MQRGPARHPSKDIQAGPAQGRVAVAHGDAELSDLPRDEGVPRESRAPGLHCVVSQGTKQRQRRSPRRRPNDSLDRSTKGRPEDTRW
jgi:hypothetical protein